MITEISDADPDWIYLINTSARENLSEIKQNKNSVGKYLFYSDDKTILINLAKHILSQYFLFEAKVPLSDVPRKAVPGFGFVLCVYDSEPKFEQELKQYADEHIIRYRYWKSNKKTSQGVYSKEFLKTQK